MTDPLKNINTRSTPQSEPIPGTVPNSGGGYSFAVDDWTRLNRFLILGTEGGTYYTSEKALTKDNADNLMRCIKADGARTVRTIVEISVQGRNPKQHPVMFALAACAGADEHATRRAALDAIPAVCRTGTHLFLFARYVEQFRGWGRGLRSAIAGWYENQDPADLVLQLAKYEQREGWSHRDLLRLSKPRPPRGEAIDLALGWATGKREAEDNTFLGAVEDIKTAPKRQAIKLITEYRLPWEVVPDALKNDPEVLEALVPGMGATALLRNLGRLTYTSTLKPMGGVLNLAVVSKLTNPEYIRRSRVHPLQVLIGSLTYAQGHGDKGSKSWSPIHAVVDALDETFKLAFGNVRPAGVPTLLALDVSSSMGWPKIAGTPLTPAVASAAMALVTAASEEQYHIMAFAETFKPVSITAKSSLTHAVATTHRMNFGSTNCSAPMEWAAHNKVPVQNFVVYTDSETNTGRAHPVQALRTYRQKTGLPARLTVVGMVSNGFSIADPTDGGMLDVVGFDTAAPQLIADFGGGRI